MSVAGRGPVRRRSADDYRVHLSSRERETLGMLCGQLRALLTGENPASDPAVARLFPPAYPDDVLSNLEYEQATSDDLLIQRLDEVDTLERTVDSDRLTEEDLLAWLGSINSVRLVLGTRLDVTEESTEADFADDETAHDTYGLYLYLTWLEEGIVGALSTAEGD